VGGKQDEKGILEKTLTLAGPKKREGAGCISLDNKLDSTSGGQTEKLVCVYKVKVSLSRVKRRGEMNRLKLSREVRDQRSNREKIFVKKVIQQNTRSKKGEDN